MPSNTEDILAVGHGVHVVVLFNALAWADVLLTRDTGDFGEILGGSFYELQVLTPGDFLQRERLAGRL